MVKKSPFIAKGAGTRKSRVRGQHRTDKHRGLSFLQGKNKCKFGSRASQSLINIFYTNYTRCTNSVLFAKVHSIVLSRFQSSSMSHMHRYIERGGAQEAPRKHTLDCSTFVYRAVAHINELDNMHTKFYEAHTLPSMNSLKLGACRYIVI